MPTSPARCWTLGAVLCVEGLSAGEGRACMAADPNALLLNAPAGQAEEGGVVAAKGALPAPGQRLPLASSDLVQAALPCLRTVLAGSRFGVSDQETAAWLVADPRSGELSCRLWPPTAKRGEARWSGPMPRGVVAQIHSHPTRAASGRQWTPRPSQNDCRTARELAVPVLTVSLEGVYECRPTDGRIVPHLGASWEQISERASG